MSFNVNFYKFNKKPNSTKQPDGLTPTTFLCDFWGNFDMAAPVLKVEAEMDIITKYTYCEIPVWGKLYFVQTYGWDRGFVTVTLTPDVLGTYKSFVVDRSQFILRTTVTSLINPYLSDTVYPAYSNLGAGGDDIGEVSDPSSGIYVVETAGSGGNVLYAMTKTSFTVLTNWFFTQPRDTFWETFVVASVQNAVGTFLDPLSYIASCYFVPVNDVAIIEDTTVKLGYWDSGVPAMRTTALSMLRNSRYNITIPDSYYATSNTWYLNVEPYTHAYVNLPFSGTYPLPLTGGRTFRLSVRVDVQGNIFYQIRRGAETDTGAVVLEANGKCGFPVGFGTNTTNIIATAGNAISAGATASKNPVASVSGVLDTISSIVPHATIMSRTSPGSADNSKITTYYEFARIGPGTSNLGYPAYTNASPSAPGWYQCHDAKIDWIDEMYEYDKTKDYMDNGFFVE